MLGDEHYNKSVAMLCCVCLVAKWCLTLCDLMDYIPPGSSVHGDSPGKNTGVGCHALLQGGLRNLGIEPRSPALRADSLPAEPSGSPQYVRQKLDYILCFQ